jgi:hypothetical protein
MPTAGLTGEFKHIDAAAGANQQGCSLLPRATSTTGLSTSIGACETQAAVQQHHTASKEVTFVLMHTHKCAGAKLLADRHT